PEDEVPVGHVTNGVHMPTWDSEAADTLWTNACGKNRWLGITDSLENDIRKVPDHAFWKLRNDARTALVLFVRDRLSRQLSASDASPEAITAAGNIFDPTVLTIGFARRFASYKRPNLLLHNPDRLVRILTNPDRPVQLILAGKAHPADQAGKDLIQQWTQFIKQPGVSSQVVFLSDYDMLLTEQLVQGVDVWLNTPRRPWEASGTSGMKVLVNGGINLSELDGWWVEAYTSEAGWAIGDGQEHGDDPSWDAAEADALYDILENEVIPEFYARDVNGISTAWTARMRESMARLTPYFSTNRSMREYVDQYYLPAAVAYLKRAENQGVIGAQISRWQQQIDQKWNAMHFGELKTEVKDDQYLFEIQLYLNDMNPDSVTVEIYANSNGAGTPTRFAMKQIHALQDAPALPNMTDWVTYRGAAPASRPIEDYTVRLIPHHEGVLVPLETAQILWQR
ncbi:MAG: alpha-glucan family phosphorylase, partial [Bacillota bacterium]|nr:alpha-glucan family phosphorylase [Bacillota bacterium]